jgi:hypothetical protein
MFMQFHLYGVIMQISTIRLKSTALLLDCTAVLGVFWTSTLNKINSFSLIPCAGLNCPISNWVIRQKKSPCYLIQGVACLGFPARHQVDPVLLWVIFTHPQQLVFLFKQHSLSDQINKLCCSICFIDSDSIIWPQIVINILSASLFRQKMSKYGLRCASSLQQINWFMRVRSSLWPWSCYSF